MSRKLTLAWLPAASYMLLIWILSSIPTAFRFEFVPFKDKGVHFIEYGVLAALLAHAMRGTWPDWRWVKIFLAAWSVAAFWGLLDEIHQAFVPGRVSEVRDVLADTLGGFLGAVIYLGIRAAQGRSGKAQVTPP